MKASTTRTYSKVEEFLAETKEYLEENEAANGLLLGICDGLPRNPEKGQDPHFAAVLDEAGPALGAVMTPPRSIVLSTAGRDAHQAAKTLARGLQREAWPIPGVLGPTEVAAPFAVAWTGRSGVPHGIRMQTRVYELRAVVHPHGVPGHFRRATEHDVHCVAEWISAFHDEAVESCGEAEAQRLAERHIAAGEAHLWEDGQPVSLASRVRTTRRGAMIGTVYTPPEFRRRGYATACVAALSQALLDSGRQFCALFADLTNPQSNSIYQKMGYKEITDFTEYRFQVGS